MPHAQHLVRRMFEIVEAIGTVSFAAETTDEFLAIGMRDYWDGYFAGRAAPLGRASAEVVDAVFYNFAPGEVARHVPWIWTRTTPAEAIVLRERGSVATLRRRLGALAEAPAIATAAALAARAATSGPSEGRPLYAGLLALEVPDEPLAKLWHAATMLREHRGDGHNALLVAHGIDRTEAHVLLALRLGQRPEEFGRLHHLPAEQIAAAVERLEVRGIVDDAGFFTDEGRAVRERIEDRTDVAASPAYDVLGADELERLITVLDPVVDALSG